MNRRRGFTLMEMLLTTALIGMLGVAIFNAFANGFKLWARGLQLDEKGDLDIWMDKMGEDLRSLLPVSQISFQGTAMTIKFPCLVLTQADRNSARAREEVVDQIGAVEYRFEPAEGKIFRRQANYGQAVAAKWGPDQVVAAGIEELTFQYYFLRGKRLEPSEKSQSKIPVGVLAKMRLKQTGTWEEIKRYFAIPVGGS